MDGSLFVLQSDVLCPNPHFTLILVILVILIEFQNHALSFVRLISSIVIDRNTQFLGDKVDYIR